MTRGDVELVQLCSWPLIQQHFVHYATVAYRAVTSVISRSDVQEASLGG